ncbi:hypothetical protein [Paenibacillus sp. ALE2]
MLFSIDDVRRLNRNKNAVFFSINTLHTLRLWNLPLLSTDTINPVVVVVSYERLVSHSTDKIQISNPVLLYPLPNGEDEDEYVVLFVMSEYHLAEYCEKLVLSYDFISRLIEKKDKLSSNSTKLMTLHSFQSILKIFNDLYIERELWPKLCRDFIHYLKSLTEKYPYLGYLQISERKKFRKSSIADSNFAWRLYVHYFVDVWDVEDREVKIPDLSKPFQYMGWTGDFFHRDNPLWNSYLSANGKFRFNDAVRESVYQIWKEWIK